MTELEIDLQVSGLGESSRSKRLCNSFAASGGVGNVDSGKVPAHRPFTVSIRHLPGGV